MKIEKWIYNGKEIDVPIVDDDDIEINEDLDYLENTIDLSNKDKDENNNER